MKTPWPFIVSLAATALSGSALILLVPTLIQTSSVWSVVVASGPGGLAIASGVFSRRVRPALQAPDK